MEIGVPRRPMAFFLHGQGAGATFQKFGSFIFGAGRSFWYDSWGRVFFETRTEKEQQ
jgi:hypothetical protein